jgi:uncharacterized membrane protein
LNIKQFKWLILIDILTILLVLAIILFPSSIIRAVIGLPFMLFFPGYTLTAALFPVNKKRDVQETEGIKSARGIDAVERTALSFGMSIAVTSLLGLILNYTPWGISLIPVLITNSAFIIIMSIIAMIRLNRLPEDLKTGHWFRLRIPGWSGSTLNKTLSAILTIAILGVVVSLVFTIVNPKIGEKYSEFYILGNTGQADDYPTVFKMAGGIITEVSYDKGVTFTEDKEGRVTLGIINKEQETISYSVQITINGLPADIDYNGTTMSRLEKISLEQGEKWEELIGFAPKQIGEKQKVELSLFNNDSGTPEDTLHFWISVKASN